MPDSCAARSFSRVRELMTFLVVGKRTKSISIGDGFDCQYMPPLSLNKLCLEPSCQNTLRRRWFRNGENVILSRT